MKLVRIKIIIILFLIFYTKLKVHLDECSEKSVLLKKQRNDSKKLLGEYNGKNLYVYEGKYGPCLQLGDKNVVFIGVDSLDITYEQAILNVNIQRHWVNIIKKTLFSKKENLTGLEHNKQNYKLKEEYDEHLTLENAIDCIENSKNKLIKKLVNILLNQVNMVYIYNKVKHLEE